MSMQSPFIALLRRAAPKLSRQLFQCHQRSKPPSNLPTLSSLRTAVKQAPRVRQSPKALLARYLSQPKAIQKHSGSTVRFSTSTWKRTNDSALEQSSRFPATSSNVVAYWLLGSAASVLGIVVFGGLTRLTESG